jgi:serine/threonine protein phosphatase PrpC
VAYNPGHPDYFMVVLKEALEALNQALYHMATSNSSMAAMGTTVTVALIQGPHLFIGHVGDSRAYLLHADRLSRLTQDHTWVAEQVQAGWLSPAQATRHPRRHVLTRALGQASLVRVDRDMHALAPGDMILLCSDGLNSVVTEQVIYQALRSAPTAQAACDQLVTLANQHGGPDNISVLVARLRPAGSGSNLPEGRIMGPDDRRTSAAPPPPALDARASGYVIAHLQSTLVRGLLGRCTGWIARQWVRSGAPAREQAKE